MNKDIFERISLYDFSNSDMSLIEYCCCNRINGIIWHRIEDARKYYKSVLNLDFPNDNGIIKGAVKKRHDLVHRNGKTKDGCIVKINETELGRLIDTVNNLVEYICKEYSPFSSCVF